MPRSTLSFVVNGACYHRISLSSFCRSVARLQFASSNSFFFRQKLSSPFPGLFLCFSDTTSFSRETFLHCAWTIHLCGDLNGGGHQLDRINLGIGVPDEAVVLVLVLHCRETKNWITHASCNVSFAIKHRPDRCTAHVGCVTVATVMRSLTVQDDPALIDRRLVYRHHLEFPKCRIFPDSETAAVSPSVANELVATVRPRVPPTFGKRLCLQKKTRGTVSHRDALRNVSLLAEDVHGGPQRLECPVEDMILGGHRQRSSAQFIAWLCWAPKARPLSDPAPSVRPQAKVMPEKGSLQQPMSPCTSCSTR